MLYINTLADIASIWPEFEADTLASQAIEITQLCKCPAVLLNPFIRTWHFSCASRPKRECKNTRFLGSVASKTPLTPFGNSAARES